MRRRGRNPQGARAPRAEAHRPKPPRSGRDCSFDYAGTTGEIDQNEYGGDLYGGGRYGRGPFEQSQRYGEHGFGSGTGAYGSLQRQFENRYASGGGSARADGSAKARVSRPAAGTARTRSATPARAKTARRSPKGDQRSDQRIRQDICERLSQPVEAPDVSDLANEHLDVSDVRVSVEGGMVMLEGTVPERRMKHYIEDLVDACPGVQDIENRIRVRR